MDGKHPCPLLQSSYSFVAAENMCVSDREGTSSSHGWESLSAPKLSTFHCFAQCPASNMALSQLLQHSQRMDDHPLRRLNLITMCNKPGPFFALANTVRFHSGRIPSQHHASYYGTSQKEKHLKMSSASVPCAPPHHQHPHKQFIFTILLLASAVHADCAASRLVRRSLHHIVVFPVLTIFPPHVLRFSMTLTSLLQQRPAVAPLPIAYHRRSSLLESSALRLQRQISAHTSRYVEIASRRS